MRALRTFQTITTFLLFALALTGSQAFAIDTCRSTFDPAAGQTLRFSDLRGAAPQAPQAGMRPLNTVKELKVLEYNVENFFVSVGKFDRGAGNSFTKVNDGEAKPAWALEGVAEPLLELDPDVMILEEIESLQALQQFNSQFLGGKYRPYLIDGNDERGINIGFYVKADLPLAVTLETHKDVTWTDPVDHQVHPLFSRDVPALVIRRQGQTGQPLMIILGNHAKSKRDRAGDPLSEIVRVAQYKAMGDIIDGYRKQYGQDVPLLMAGDFNTDVPSSPSVKPIRDRLDDALDVAGVKGLDRTTQSFHPRNGPAQYSQLDAVMVTPALASSIEEAKVYRYKDQNGNVKPLPTTYDERSTNPSDHFPVFVRITTEKIFPEAYGAAVAKPVAPQALRPAS